MKIKHKIIKDFSYISADKKITLLKSGTMIEDFIYRTKVESILLDRDVVNSNPDYFQVIDWKQDLLAHMKQNKVPQPAIIAKKIFPYLEEMLIVSIASQTTNPDIEKEFKDKLQQLQEKEALLDKENKERRRELDEKEKDFETKLTQKEVEMEKKYRSKLMEVANKEAELETKLLEIQRSSTDSSTSLLEVQNLKSQFQMKELEIQKEAETKLTAAQIELEKNYREKLLQVMEKESTLDIKTSRLNQRQEEFDKSIQKLEDKESDLRQKQEDLSKKLEELRDVEYQLNQKERSIDKTILQNTKDLDEKQTEMNQKLQEKLLDLEKRESALNDKLEDLSKRELAMYDEFSEKVKSYEAEYETRLDELKNREKEALLTNYDKIKHIERLVNDYYASIPWYHNQMWETKSKIEEIIEEFKKL
jgi:hypothetical protein